MNRRFTKPDSEAVVHERVVKYLKRDHKGVVFRTDFAAGIKLPLWLARRQRILQYKRGFPDLTIFAAADKFYGLCLELKKPGTRLKKLDGDWSSQHIMEQFGMLAELNAAGYAAAFAVGYDEAVDIIEAYFNGTFLDLPWLDFSLQQYKTPEVIHEQEDIF